MGEFMKEDDVYVGGMLDLLNIRFGPSVGGPRTEWFGGVDEMARLQREFELFKQGRSFRDSAAVLNLGGQWNARVKNRWLDFLSWLRTVGSNIPGKTGDEAIVDAIIEDLGNRNPVPIYFMGHHAPDLRNAQVSITPRGTPLFYFDREFLTISLPMRPRAQQPARSAATRRRRTT